MLLWVVAFLAVLHIIVSTVADHVTVALSISTDHVLIIVVTVRTLRDMVIIHAMMCVLVIHGVGDKG